ncbi:MAG: ABC transporter ATP-binding protein, partial [Candidatus Brocadiia bacterium]
FVSFYYAMLIVMGKIFEIGFLLISFRRTLVSVERIKALEQHEPDVREQRSPLTVKSLHVDIAFENVGFSYDGGPDLALSGVTFTVRRGQKIGIVGPVGSGKSTLLGLLPRLYDATEGKLLVDGVDIRQFRLESLRKRIGYVPQEPLLFSETLENNVIFGREGISPEMVRWACEVSQFANDLTSFPEGMQTKVGHRGMTLSGGQKQRLSIARALVTKPDVLILDDCSSALDASTEARLWIALAKELPGTTIFVVSHRIASVKDADLIVVFDHGKQVATGRHAQLLSEGIPVYRELVDAQLGATKAATECPEPPSPPDSDIGRAVV